jgi:hypothetical protein
MTKMTNREDIIRMAREADLIDDSYASDWYIYQLERFAALVAAKEREACVKFVEDGYERQFERPWREDLAAAIRARSNNDD